MDTFERRFEGFESVESGMKAETLLLRQIHPHFVQNGRVTSQAFRPTLKDECRLSVDNGDMVSPEVAWERFTSQVDCRSSGVMALSQGECAECELSVIQDGIPYDEHCYLDFTGLERKQSERIGKRLGAFAQTRGWQYTAKSK